MDTQHLRAFLMVAEYALFSEAAVHLHLTQPAVSKRVATLEQQLGTALFDRIGRRVSLTEAGAALLPHARTIRQNLDQAQVETSAASANRLAATDNDTTAESNPAFHRDPVGLSLRSYSLLKKFPCTSPLPAPVPVARTPTRAAQ